MEASMSDEPRIEVVRVPHGPDLQRAMKAAEQFSTQMDDMAKLLSPEGMRRLEEAEAEITHRFLFGDGSDADTICPGEMDGPSACNCGNPRSHVDW
jgi:hypothetical protein